MARAVAARVRRVLLVSAASLAGFIVLSAVVSLVFAVFPFPTGVRLDIGPDPTQIVVRWSTDEVWSEFGEEVVYGPADGSWNRTAVGSSRVVFVWADSARWLRPLHIHEALLVGLEPGQAYRYQIPRDHPRTFELPTNSSLRVVAFADMGVSGEAAALAAHAAASRPHLALVAGDLAYADGDAADWTRWLEIVEPLGSRAPLLPARGNHELEPPFGSRNFRALFPERASYYSYERGPVHFVHLDTEISMSDAGHASAWSRAARREAEQEAWLAEDLAAARSLGASWVVVVMHEPAYSSGRVHGSNAAVRERWVPLFDEYDVDLVIQGHDHSYQRTFPLRNGSIDPEGAVYLVTGGGGRILYDRFISPTPSWSAFHAAVHEYVQLDITRDELKIRAVGLDGQTLDEMTLGARGSTQAS